MTDPTTRPSSLVDRVRSAALWSAIVADTAALGDLVIGLSLVDDGGFLTYHVGRFWSRLNLRLLGIEVTASGAEHVAPGQSYVVMANHQSYCDIWATFAALPLQLRWVMKRELRKIPVFGYACGRMGHIYVERGNREDARASMAEAARRIASGTSVVFFPEGTRSTTGVLGPFKSGGFRLALAGGVPLLPVSITGTGRTLAAHSWIFHPGRVHVAVSAPIPTAGRGDDALPALMDETRAAILAGMRPDRR
jgi:1-acyl-sn-glycerol-3-phosphate acyltransferase